MPDAEGRSDYVHRIILTTGVTRYVSSDDHLNAESVRNAIGDGSALYTHPDPRAAALGEGRTTLICHYLAIETLRTQEAR